MARVYNFSAGPSILPEVVLKQAAEEMLDYKGSGQSVMEMSHRSKVYDDIIKEAEKDLRDLMDIPDNYKVLFLQGGASQQFAAIPMNLMKNGVVSGLRRLGRKLRSMERLTRLLHQRTRLSHIFLIVQTFLFQMMLIMYTFVITIQSMELHLKSFLIQRGRFL